jgi:hypothetical protein
MARTIAWVAAGALALSTVLVGPAPAKVTGDVTCTLTGSATISPGLPVTSPGVATKKVKTKTTFTGTLSNCTGTQVGTKKGAQIEGGTVKAKAKTTTAVGDDLPSCAGLTAPTAPTVLKATVKFKGGGKTLATSTVNLTIGAATVDGALNVSFPASGAVKGGSGFKGQTLTATAILDQPVTGFDTVCAGGKTTTFEFTGLRGDSTLVVAP